MADWLPKETRSKIMSSIRSSKTGPELALKKALHGKGFSYQPKINGSPDFVHKRDKIAIFVHGCFWHKCPKCFREPTSNKEYWIPKLEKNTRRDRENKKLLREKGYKVVEIWEHEIKNNLSKVIKKIQNEQTKN